ncbi:MAG: hypothetical protein JNK00_00495 [Flavipsychrobacter sp.]|nr:hypothetical protein [Flavipsychrobacter sp.]
MIQVRQVSNRQMLKAFIDFPHELYKYDDNYVPELFIAQRDLLTPGKHPFHNHSQTQLFLAYQNGLIRGRIAAILNRNHNQFNQANDGFFGFFDTVEDHLVADALFTSAEKWLAGKGARTSIGPVNFSTNETCGMLVNGFVKPPVVMMPYNKPYYSTITERFGYSKKVDLIAYNIDAALYNDKPLVLMPVLEQRLKNKDIVFRKVELKNFREEVRSLQVIYNQAWDKNLGFVPMTVEEFEHMAKDLKLILDPEFCVLAEHNGKAVGFSLCIPDINQVLRSIDRGRLLPTGFFKLLTRRKSIDGIRVLALGVLEGYRKLGIETVLYGRIIQNCLNKKITKAEASWILEDNYLMNKALTSINAVPYKTYRIYEKALV